MKEIRVSKPLPLDGAFNVRDLGGYPAADGKTTRDHVFLRADSLHGLTPEDRQKLYDYGVRLVIDVRSGAETQKNEDAIDRTVMKYVGHPLLDNVQSQFLQGEMPSDMGEMYVRLVENSKDVFADLFRDLTAEEGCALYHCTAGKDRTGVISALLLKLAGVPDEVVVADYAVSERYMQPVFDQQKAMLKKMGIAAPEFVFRSRPPFMEKLLLHIENTYSDAKGYLEAAGLSQEEIRKLKNKLV